LILGFVTSSLLDLLFEEGLLLLRVGVELAELIVEIRVAINEVWGKGKLGGLSHVVKWSFVDGADWFCLLGCLYDFIVFQ